MHQKISIFNRLIRRLSEHYGIKPYFELDVIDNTYYIKTPSMEIKSDEWNDVLDFILVRELSDFLELLQMQEIENRLKSVKRPLLADRFLIHNNMIYSCEIKHINVPELQVNNNSIENVIKRGYGFIKLDGEVYYIDQIDTVLNPNVMFEALEACQVGGWYMYIHSHVQTGVINAYINMPLMSVIDNSRIKVTGLETAIALLDLLYHLAVEKAINFNIWIDNDIHIDCQLTFENDFVYMTMKKLYFDNEVIDIHTTISLLR